MVRMNTIRSFEMSVDIFESDSSVHPSKFKSSEAPLWEPNISHNVQDVSFWAQDSTHKQRGGFLLNLALQICLEYRFLILFGFMSVGGPGSVVGIATGCGLDGPGIESRWGARFSAPVQTGPGARPASCTMDTESFAGVKAAWG